MINILYISNQDSFKGGAPRSLFEIITNVDRRKIMPFFASIHDGELAKQIKKLDVKFHKIPNGYKFHPLLTTPSFCSLVNFINEQSIDLIHNNQCGDAFYSWMPAKFTKTPMIIHHRDPSFYRSSKFLLNIAEKNIAISSWQNEHNLDNKGIVIHNAIDVTKFSTHKRSDSKYGTTNNNIVIGLIGRITYDKAQDVFIIAAAKVLKKHQNVHFLIVGDDTDKYYSQYIHTLKNLVSDLNLEKKVSFTGYVPNGYEILPYFDVSVVPSRREPFGRTIIESMACGKPVVATNVWGALDIVTPETGILIPPDDPKALANSIVKLIELPELRMEMGKAGRKRAEEHFSINIMLQKLYQAYYSLLGRNHDS